MVKSVGFFLLRGYPPEGDNHNRALCRKLPKLLTLGCVFAIIYVENKRLERYIMADLYKKMLDDTFTKYYERFRELNALSKENAVTKAELFPDGQNLLDPDRMHKMLSAGIVKRVGFNRYWLDENRANDSKGILKQRLLIVVLGLIFGLILVALEKMGIINL